MEPAATITVTVNGEPMQVAAGTRLSDLLATPGGAQIGAGSRVCCQAWARDKADAFGTSL